MYSVECLHVFSLLQERNIWLSLVGALQKKDKLPIIAFTFSRKRCDENANSLNNLDLLCNSAERSEVHVFFQKSMMRLKGSDKNLPQVGCSVYLVNPKCISSSDNLDVWSPQTRYCSSSQWYTSYSEGGWCHYVLKDSSFQITEAGALCKASTQ